MQKDKIPEIIMEHEFATIPLTVLVREYDERNDCHTKVGLNNIFYSDHHVYLPERQSVKDREL